MDFIWMEGKTGFAGCRLVRKKVFVEEQGFSEASEFDAIDGPALHLLVEDGGTPVAAARIFREEGDGCTASPCPGSVWHVGRICVLPDYRGAHLGAAILAEAEAEVRRRGGVRLELGAQVRASGFYERCGYTVCGDRYMDEFCPHVRMGKDLT